MLFSQQKSLLILNTQENATHVSFFFFFQLKALYFGLIYRLSTAEVQYNLQVYNIVIDNF